MTVRNTDVLAVVACAALGFLATRVVGTGRGNTSAPPTADAPGARGAPRLRPDVALAGLSPDDVRALLDRPRAIAAAPRVTEPPASRRQVLAPIFEGDELEQALLALASGSASSDDGFALREVLRRDPQASLAAIENVMARLPDPSTGTGPAHEILLRVATTTLGLDAQTRLDFLRRELTTSEADDGRPHRPVAALGLVLGTEPADRARALFLEALQRQTDVAIRNELTLTFASAYPEPGQALTSSDGQRTGL